MSEVIDSILEQIAARREVLKPLIEEYGWLLQMEEIIEHADRMRQPPATWPAVVAWVETELDPTDSVRPRDVADQFDKSPAFGSRMCKRLVAEGYFEVWGRGMYRRRPDRTGRGHLRVVTR